MAVFLVAVFVDVDVCASCELCGCFFSNTTREFVGLFKELLVDSKFDKMKRRNSII